MFSKSVKEKDFSKTSKLIYGFPKTGKTTFCSKFKNKDGKDPVFIATEDGFGSLEVFVQRVTSWESFKKLVEVIQANEKEIKEGYSCFVIDLVSDIDSWCTDYICRSNNVKALADLKFGKGWQLQSDEFKREMLKLMQILPVNYIAHAKEKEVTWQGKEIKTQMPSMATRCLEFINGKVDSIMYVDAITHRDKNIITMKPSDLCIAGSRFKHICQDYDLNYNDMESTYGEISNNFETGATV